MARARSAKRKIFSNEDEVIVTDPKTGGKKGVKLAELSAIDPIARIRLAEVAGHGTRKYGRLNFARGYTYSQNLDALHRHVLAFEAGEYLDKDSGMPHLAHAMWHCAALMTFWERGIGTDDRFGAVSALRGRARIPDKRSRRDNLLTPRRRKTHNRH
jgi:hypothetical protein